MTASAVTEVHGILGLILQALAGHMDGKMDEAPAAVLRACEMRGKASKTLAALMGALEPLTEQGEPTK